MAQWELRYLGQVGLSWESLVLSSFLISTLNAVIRDLGLHLSHSLFKYPRNQTYLPNRELEQALPSSASQKHLDRVSCNSKGFSEILVQLG